MIGELGTLTLLLALAAALYQGLFPLAGASLSDARLMRAGAAGAGAQAVLVAAAFVLLTIAHANSDFSIANVYENSHTAKPFVYKLSGVWGSHEGSMLLWALILAGFGGVLALQRNAMDGLKARTLAVQGLIAAAFLAFILFTSNPFARIFPAPVEGQDLNPLLQDPGLAVHPPFLYFGYVGFSIVFAFAAAGLMSGRIDEAWARAVRPWATASWTFLTIGIGLGAWWAYYELGWGGFWAWDPVENASFMPWLAGTALIHSIRVTETRGAFKAWTALLALLAFSLSLVGTFLVRSGVLTSVHAFAVDPARGVFILAILAASVGGGLALYALRAPSLTSDARFDAVSREGGLFVNNILLVAACATVFIGTFYPLFAEAMSGEKLSVGAPYFNLAFTPFAFISLFILGPAAALAWKRGRLGAALGRIWPAALAGLAAIIIAFWLARPREAAALLGAGLAVWAGGSVVLDLLKRIRILEAGAAVRFAALPRSSLAMTVGHLGFAVVALGVIGAGVWKSETIAYVQPGDSVTVGGFNVGLISVDQAEGPNYVTETARFEAHRGAASGDSGDSSGTHEIVAERRFYPVRGMQTTEAGVVSTLLGDLYVTVGDRDPSRGWVVRAWRRPLALWMWIGAGLMALGGAIAALPVTARRPSPSKTPAASALKAAA
ncbi:MAG: heme lyase CcmF/NrfE family subunit [Pseudomonadota bacterium]